MTESTTLRRPANACRHFSMPLFLRGSARRLCGVSGFALVALSWSPMATAQLRVPERATTQAVGAPPPSSAGPRGDYILAIVNQELVTAAELALRMERIREAAQRSGERLPPEAEVRRQVLQALIDERVLVTAARDTGQRVDEAELDRAVNNVAVQNQITPAQLRARLQSEGVDFGRFRSNLRDQILVERTREREVQSRIRITDAEVDAEIAKQQAAAGGATEYNVAQILVSVPEGANEAQVMERRIRAEGALARVRAGEPFDAVARNISDDGNKLQGGEIGMRPANRLPDIFVNQVKNLKAGDLAPDLLRTGAGFHVLKLIDKRDETAFTITQARVSHILLRPSAQLSEAAAIRRLADFKAQVQSGKAIFANLARENSEDGSAAAGGDLGWTTPGSLVPEFEQAMDALPVGGISDPIVSRFGVHLIQVVDRREIELDKRQQREQVRNALRERKYSAAFADWLDDLRARAYIEMREPPQQ